jgi:hypothetical protein
LVPTDKLRDYQSADYQSLNYQAEHCQKRKIEVYHQLLNVEGLLFETYTSDAELQWVCFSNTLSYGAFINKDDIMLLFYGYCQQWFLWMDERRNKVVARS